MQQLIASTKSAIKRVLRPVARPIIWRIRRFTALRAEVDELRSVLPAVVNATTSVAAIGREQSRLKREHDQAIAELRAAVAQLTGGTSSAAARILSPSRLEKARAEGLKIQLGCGAMAAAGYLVVDAGEAQGVDIVAPWDALPVSRGEAQEIVACHVLEQLTPDECARLLSYWAGLLQPGGVLRAVAMDARAAVVSAAQGPEGFEALRSALVGNKPARNLFSAQSLAAALAAAGLQDVQVLAEARARAGGFELEVAGRAAG